MVAFPIVHFGLSVILLLMARSVRQLVRDVLYIFQMNRMSDDPSFSRTLVFGAGLRYRAFRRELMRKVMTEKRVIVGIVDDDLLLKGKFIGGLKIYGSHMDAKQIAEETKADSVVIACEMDPERRRAVVESFKASGLKVSCFTFSETKL